MEEIEIDHYKILGLPSAPQGPTLTLDEISKAYRTKALKLHPDKRPNDPNAHTHFQNLKSSYEILKDDKTRKLFDDLLRIKQEQLQRQSLHDAKRRRMVAELEKRERCEFDVYHGLKKKKEEEERKIVEQLKVEIERIRALHVNAIKNNYQEPAKPIKRFQSLNVERILKVTWVGGEDEYSLGKLREVFLEFGEVVDVVMRDCKKEGVTSALVEMGSKDAAVTALGTVCGDLWNPLLVMPLRKRVVGTVFSSPFCGRSVENDIDVDIRMEGHLFGESYKAKEDSVLEKLRKAGEKQKRPVEHT